MICKFPENIKKLYIHTGNVLNLNEVKKKVGQNLTDELVETLQITLKEWNEASAKSSQSDNNLQVRRKNGESSLLLGVEEDRKDLKVNVKLFLPVCTAPSEVIVEALDCLLQELNTGHIEALILAQSNHQADGVSAEEHLNKLLCLWQKIEKEISNGRILSGGVSDLDTEQFINLYSDAKVKPSIVQINLATCCVVPPALQSFTKENEVQLLTHSDPIEVLPEENMQELFGSGWKVNWALRNQVLVKCRGVLASKGYIVCVERD